MAKVDEGDGTMHVLKASDAKNRFGQMIDLARTAPVRIQKNGRDVAVVLSPEEFQRLLAAGEDGVNPAVKALHARSARRFASVYAALAK
jgi:prevent-host-death family protein